MKLLKKLIVAMVCVTFTMSAACSDDSDKNENPKVNNVNNDKADIGSDVDTDDSKDSDDKSDAKTETDTDPQTDTNPQTDTDSGGSTDTDPTEALTPEQFTEQMFSALAAVNCEVVFNCPANGNAKLVKDLGRTADQVACVEVSKKRLAAQGHENLDILEAIANSHTEFDAEKAAECLTEIAASKAACNLFDAAAIARCIDTVFIPQLIVGEECASNSECMGGYCSISVDGTCPGECIANPAKAKKGESCKLAKCDAGLECIVQSMTTSTCEIVEYVGSGVACNALTKCKTGFECTSGMCSKPVYQEKDTSCNENSRCKAGLTCVGAINNAYVLEGTCKSIRKANEACLFPLQCAHGLHCDSTDIDVPGKCFALRVAGEACNDNGGEFDWCDDHLECVKDGATNKSTCKVIETALCEIAAG